MNFDKKYTWFFIATLLVLPSCDSNGSNIKEYTFDMLNCNKERSNCYDKHNNKPITGIVKEYYDKSNKRIKSEITYNDGLINGSTKSYYIDGKIKGEFNFINGEKYGVSKSYYSNGQLKSEDEFENGKLSGISKHYYENGQLEMEATFKNGDINGTIKEYYENGIISSEYVMRDGWRLQDIKYDSKGNKVSEEKYEYKKYGTTTSGYKITYNSDGSVKGKEDMVQYSAIRDEMFSKASNSRKNNNNVNNPTGVCPNYKYCLDIKNRYEVKASPAYCHIIKNEGTSSAQLMAKEYKTVEDEYWREINQYCPDTDCNHNDFKLDPFRFCHF